MIGNILRYRYELIEKIGDGFLFSAYRARDRVQNRIIALKLVRPPFNENEQTINSLRQVVFTAAKLNSAAIARVYELDEHEGMPFVTCEFARGANLKTRIARVASLSVPVAVDTSIGIAEALDSAHRSGFLHSDLCPQNVIVGMDGEVKVTDFTLLPVYLTSAELTKAYLSRIVPYLAPEVLRGNHPSALSDVYSIGVLMAEMLTGDVPYSNDLNALSRANPPERKPISVRTLNPGVPATVEEMIVKATAENPDERYQSAAELLYDLKSVRDALRFGRPLTWSPLSVSRPASPHIAVTGPTITDALAAANSLREEEAVSLPEPVAAPLNSVKETERKASDGRPLISAPKPPEPAPEPEVVIKDAAVPLWLKVTWSTLLILVVVGFIMGAGFLFWNWYTPGEVAVPDLIGKSRQDAETILKNKGLLMKVVKTITDEKYPPNTVFYTQPTKNSPIKKGNEVQVWLSKGSKYVKVPNVQNMSEEEATKTLKDLDLSVVVNPTKKPSDKLPYGYVLSQDPKPDTRLERGKVVYLVLSDGPAMAVEPDNTVPIGSRERYIEIAVNVPSGNKDAEVRIEVEDDLGVHTAWEGSRPPGESFSQTIVVRGDNVVVRVFVDNKLIKEEKIPS